MGFSAATQRTQPWPAASASGTGSEALTPILFQILPEDSLRGTQKAFYRHPGSASVGLPENKKYF